MKIAVLGGSFNPPHLGHVLVIDQVLKYTDIDEIWLAPCYRHTFEKHLAPVEHRVAMTKMLVSAGQGRSIKYCGEEIDNQLSGETIELMELLEKKYPQHQFSFLIGSDNLAGLKKWGQWQKLISNFQFLIFPRSGFSTNLVDSGLNNPRYRFQTINFRLLTKTDISSTFIRDQIKKGFTIKHLVPEKIEEYIVKKKLYRP